MDNGLNEQNNNEINVKTGVDKSPEENVAMTNKKSQKGLFIGISAASLLIIMVIVISVVMTMTIQRKNDVDNGNGNGNSGDSSVVVDDGEDEGANNDGGIDLEDEYADAVEASSLPSGTVTTTIGGKTVSYTAKYVVDGVTARANGGTYESTSDDEVVFLVINGGKLLIENATINKTGSADFNGRGDNYSFYGTNSAIVVVGEGSQIGMANVTVNTSTGGANAVVATDSGSVISGEITINTTKDSSRGLHATYGGKIISNGGVITTQGQSSAALATDRGAGTVKAAGMELSTAGAGSPLIYSTGEISVASSTGIATGAQIAVVEGKNSIEINDCDFSTNGIGNRNSVDNAAIMIYQSMSGDASMGMGEFYAADSKLTVLPESSVYATTPFFFVTNTTANIELSNVVANFYADGYFVLAAGTNEWGKTGSNGGIVTIEATDLTATNTNIGMDEISEVKGL